MPRANIFYSFVISTLFDAKKTRKSAEKVRKNVLFTIYRINFLRIASASSAAWMGAKIFSRILIISPARVTGF